MLLRNFCCRISIRFPWKEEVEKCLGYPSTLSTSIRATTLGLSGKATTLITSLKPVYLDKDKCTWYAIEFLRIASLDGDLVKEGAVLDGVHIQVEFLTLPAVTDQVALVRSDHDVLEFLVL